MYRCPIVIFWSDEDGAYVGDVPDLRSCSAHGDTLEEALREVRVALDLRFEAARKLGVRLPEPSSVGRVLQPAGRR